MVRKSADGVGGTTWMGVLLWLEHFGLDAQRDNILLQVLGDQNIQAQAVEPASPTPPHSTAVWSKKLKQKGFTILGEYSDLNQRIVGQAMVAPHVFLNQRGDIVESYLKAEIEALAFALAPEKQIRRHQNADEAAQNRRRRRRGRLSGSTQRRRPQTVPFAGRPAQCAKMLKMRTPKIGEIKAKK